jgi:hypothetical protein
VNAAGIRSDREYSFAKPPGVHRILVFGDSMAGGIAQPNERRATELIERRNPRVEVINLCLTASATDQQLLLFEEIGRRYEHDVVLLLPYVGNIRRNLVSQLVFSPWGAGRRGVLRLKPRFTLATDADGTEVLELHNVPIPEPPPDSEADRPDARAVARPTLVDRIAGGYGRLRATLRPARLAKRYLFPLFDRIRFDPFPLLAHLGYDPLGEYESEDTEEWRLMAAIIRRFARATEPRPLVIAPIVNSTYMRFAVGRNYWERFRSLDDGERVHVVDLLPYFLALGRRAVDCYLEPHDNHLSDLGQSVLADAIEAELRRLELLPVGDAGS